MNYRLYKNARNASWDILLKCGVSSLPVSVSGICKQLGIRIKTYEHDGESDGFCIISQDGTPVVCIKKSAGRQRQRFTAAHELGHILLGHIGKYELINREPSPDDSPVEHEANIFASRLLAPACVLWALDVHSAEDISRICDISLASARFRKERMDVLYRREIEYQEKYGRSCFLLDARERQLYKQFEDFISRQTNRERPLSP